jgi:hypothetical protein
MHVPHEQTTIYGLYLLCKRGGLGCYTQELEHQRCVTLSLLNGRLCIVECCVKPSHCFKTLMR